MMLVIEYFDDVLMRTSFLSMMLSFGSLTSDYVKAP